MRRSSQIVAVESHPAALAQCEQFFAAHPNLKRIAAEDTAGSVREVVQSTDRTRAAIAGRSAAQIYGGQILREHLEDNPENYTRFLSSRLAAESIGEADKLSLVFQLAHLPGALCRALEPFARRNINMLKIESRPVHGRPWQYRFYLDLQASRNEPDVEEALAELAKDSPSSSEFWEHMLRQRSRKVTQLSHRKRSRNMIVNMAVGATEAQINHVVARIKECGFEAHLSRGEERTVIGVVGKSDQHRSELEALCAAPGVEEIIRIWHPFKLASRNFRPEGTIIDLGKGVSIGGTEVIVAAGPCAVESAAQIDEIAERVAQAGAKLLRGGAFKPRSSPYRFQGLGEDGLKLMRAAADRNGLLVVSEVMDPSQIEVMLPYVDVLQVGARNMQNYHLLRALGEIDKPVLLKRGMSATIEELLLSAEYIMSGGNYKVILCERGIRTFDNYMRNTMDIAAIPVIKSFRICRSWPILRMGPGAATRCLPWRVRRLRRARTGCW